MRRVTIALPTRDLRRAFEFYRDGLRLPLSVPAGGDEMPEPVDFAIGAGVHLMIVPADGFGWVIGDNTVAGAGVSECVVSLGVNTEAEVGELIENARAAGASVIAAPGQQPWGYSASFRDLDGHVWMVIVTDRPS